MDKKIALNSFLENFLGTDGELYEVFNRISKVRRLDKKEILFLENQEGKYVYYLVQGSIKLYKTNDEGKEAVINFVKPGEIFAEILLFLENRYPVTSQALEDTFLLELNAEGLYEEIKKMPELSMTLIGALSRRIKYFVNMIENLTLNDVAGRFMNYLELIKTRQGVKTVTLPVPKGELALLMGTTPETFSRVLKKLSEDGVIEVSGKEITILKEVVV